MKIKIILFARAHYAYQDLVDGRPEQREMTATRIASRDCSSSHAVEAVEAVEVVDPDISSNGWEAVPCHPLRVKPSGNALVASSDLRGAIGSLNILPDELILTCLEYLDSTSLLRLGCTCKALYAFTRSEDLWKAFLIGYESCSWIVSIFNIRL